MRRGRHPLRTAIFQLIFGIVMFVLAYWNHAAGDTRSMTWNIILGVVAIGMAAVWLLAFIRNQ
jgi:Na+-driven multidrug efflux pump